MLLAAPAVTFTGVVEIAALRIGEGSAVYSAAGEQGVVTRALPDNAAHFFVKFPTAAEESGPFCVDGDVIVPPVVAPPPGKRSGLQKLEPAKYGQRVVLGLVLVLDIEANSAVLELPEYRSRVRVSVSRPAADELVLVEEEFLIGKQNEGWSARFRNDVWAPGTTYKLRLQANVLTGTMTHGALQGSVTLDCNVPFRLSNDAHGPSIVLARDRVMARLSQLGGDAGSLSGLALADVGFASGTHYFEFYIERADAVHGTVLCGVAERPIAQVLPAGTPVPMLTRWEKLPSSWGFIDFRATVITQPSATATEQIYGEFFETGDVVGVLVDLDVGEISFFIDSLKYDEHIIRDLGVAFTAAQLRGKSSAKSNPLEEPLVLYPCIGLRRSPGDAVAVSPRHLSFPASTPDDELDNVAKLAGLLRGHFNHCADGPDDADKRAALPAWFLDTCFAHYKRWMLNRFRYAESRAGGRLVELDVSPEAMEHACAGIVSPPALRVGERVRLTSSYGRALRTPEEAVVLGARQGRVWYALTTVSSHEGFDEGATWAWFWTDADLAALQRLPGPRPMPPEFEFAPLEAVARDEFDRLAAMCTRAADCALVRKANDRLRAMADGADFDNLSGSDFAREERPRAAVLRVFNCMVRRALPLVGMDGQLGKAVRAARGYVFSATKRSYFYTCLRQTTTPTVLSSEEYVDPPQIRVVPVNRVRAAAAKLAAIPSASKRIKRSVFGQMYAEMHKWSDHAFRRAYSGKGHGGQRRAFKVKFVGEGVDDYGGPYRQVFEQVVDELQDDQEWPDSRRACLLPLLVPCPNRYNVMGDVGRDKFVFNPAPAGGSILRRFEFLGKLVGTACRHGLKMGLDLPSLFWRRLVGLPVSRAHVVEIDAAWARDLTFLEAAYEGAKGDDVDGSRLAALAGVERRFEVHLSDGSLVRCDGREGEVRVVTVDSIPEYVRAAVATRLHESDAQFAAFKKGLAVVLPLEVFALFTAGELEELVCGTRELDVGLLRSIVEFEGDVKADDAHVQWLWEVLEEFAPEERRAFLRFAWARSRLPAKNELSTAFKIQVQNGGALAQPDAFLPSAQTCFFALALPKYTNKDVLRQKLKLAIRETFMDLDVRLRNAEGWE